MTPVEIVVHAVEMLLLISISARVARIGYTRDGD